MPYTLKNPPDIIRALPEGAKRIWIEAFNAALKEYGDEQKAIATAWAAVKKKYEKNDEGEWMAISSQKSEEIWLVNTELDGQVPREIQVIPYGYHETPKGDFLLNEDAARQVVEEFNRRQNDMVIDYEHQTLQGTEAPAAGWIKRLINRGKDGIWAVVEWTEKAKNYIRNREYRYVSPVFLKRLSDSRVIKLFNVALTNQPNIDGMVPLVNKAGADINNRKEEQRMKDLLKLLGLPEDASQEDAIQAVNTLKEQADAAAKFVANKSILEALGLGEGATEAEVTGTIMAMKQSHTQTEDLSKQVAELSRKLAEKEATEMVEMAMKEGKITPAQKDWALDYAKRDAEGFKVFVAKAPAVVPTGNLTGGEPKGDGGVLEETQVQVNKLLGIDEETFKKYGKEE